MQNSLSLEISNSILRQDVNYFKQIFSRNISVISKQTSLRQTHVCIHFFQDVLRSDNVEIFDIFYKLSMRFIAIESEQEIDFHNHNHSFVNFRKSKFSTPPVMTIEHFIGLLTIKENLVFLKLNILRKIVEDYANIHYLIVRIFRNKVLLTSEKDYLDAFYLKNSETFFYTHLVDVLNQKTCEKVNMITAKDLIDIARSTSEHNHSMLQCQETLSIICNFMLNDKKRLFELLNHFLDQQKFQKNYFDILMTQAFQHSDIILLEFAMHYYINRSNSMTAVHPFAIDNRLLFALMNGIRKSKKVDVLSLLYKDYNKLFFLDVIPFYLKELCDNCGLNKQSSEFQELIWIVYRKTDQIYDSSVLKNFEKKWALFTKHTIDHSLLDRDTINLICSFV